MNTKYGGKKGKGMRGTEMVEGCLGEGEAKLWKVLGGDGGVLGWFVSTVAGAEHGNGTVVEVECKLKLGDTQHMELSSNAAFPSHPSNTTTSSFLFVTSLPFLYSLAQSSYAASIV